MVAVEPMRDVVNIAVASDGIFSAADTLPGKGEEDFLAERTPRAYSNRSLFPDRGTYGRY